MLYAGQAVSVREAGDGLFEVVLDLTGESVNKLNQATLQELREAVGAVAGADGVRGVLFSSAKDVFVVGADITEFTAMFERSEDEISAAILEMTSIFNSVEDLPVPTVAAINGIALGGGFELCLACDYRVMSTAAKVGLPEVKLGIYPGWGGTVRLSRLIGIDNANEWICGGSDKRADAALKDGAVDAVVAPEKLREAGLDLLRQCLDGKFDYRARRTEKQGPVALNQIEQLMAFESAKGVIGAKAGKHYPAPMAALAAMQKHAGMRRDEALKVEARGFAKLAKTEVSRALVGIFLKDQAVKKAARHHSKGAEPVQLAAVLGAGIMGGGVAYQSASRGTPILMKDIREQALQLGLDEASKLLAGQIQRGRLDSAGMAATLTRIRPTLSYGDFGDVDMVVEAVVENAKVKKAVLAEAEAHLKDGAVLASNTSTISITELATALKRPENFCGMHFFNPVHRMPLVEVIRGEKTSDAAVARTVAYAQAMGKTPIVVNDCPGFLINRILFPYFAGFSLLLRDGADFRQVDRVMEGFGWPMGPAYLLDVVGIDTAYHADAVMAAGFPERMRHEDENALDRMFALERFGQKNGKGFYAYEPDRKGKPKKVVDESVFELLSGVIGERQPFPDDDIVARMMIPLCIETARCLEDGIVASPAEADMGLVYGIGFPPFRGGALYYLDRMGLDRFCEMAAGYADLGPLYQPTERMKQMAARGETYYG
ncbi:MAG: fatty acid oxidation complex subunit alpha FadB [Oceanospirillaceae bacterium]|nr:fatty acid oxidation complex subunit alpha FadB [Oceanospirillaceae bacterium]